MNSQKIIILNGPMAGGKSTVAEILHKKIKHSVLLGNDRLKYSISDYQRTKPGIKGDRDTITEAVFLLYKFFLKSGFTVLVENFFIDPKELLLFEKYALKNEYSLHIFQIEAPEKILLSRTESRSDKMSPSINKEKISWYSKTKREEFLTFDSSKKTSDQIVGSILRHIQK